MNRIECVYEACVSYLALPVDYRYSIGSRLKLLRDDVLQYTAYRMDEIIIKEVFKRSMFEEFKRMVHHYQKSPNDD